MSERPMKPPTRPADPADLSELSDLSDLSELADTDALLDRLGDRRPSSSDLDDPAAALLAGLVSAVDEGPDVDQDVSRLVEVLAGRPLFLGAEDAADESEITASDHPIELVLSGAALSEVPADAETRVIDLTDYAPVAPAEQLTPFQDADEAGAESAAAEVVPLSHWRKALRNVSIPAAAAVALIALGSGVSAVVTGNPMAPVNGVSRVMSQLPGTSSNSSTSAQGSLNKAQAEIYAANEAAKHHDPAGAQNHLAAAQSALADVPADQKAQLSGQIVSIQKAIDTGTPPTSPITLNTPPPVGVVGTPPPVTDAPTTPAGDPTPTETETVPTTPPTTDSPVTTPPTTPPTTESTDPATSPAVDETSPAAAASDVP